MREIKKMAELAELRDNRRGRSMSYTTSIEKLRLNLMVLDRMMSEKSIIGYNYRTEGGMVIITVLF